MGGRGEVAGEAETLLPVLLLGGLWEEWGMVDVSPRQSWSALLAHGLVLGGAGAAIFLAGGAPQGNLGVFLLCAGVALVACPPRARVEWPLWAAAAGLVAGGGLAFLPARWLPTPLWRQAMAAAPAVVLPPSITAAPGETAFWLALLALSLVTGLFALSQPVRARGMIWLVLGAVTGCGVYAGLAMYAKVSGWNYPFSGGATFGFLPNRNHTATLLITGSVLALGLMSVAFRDRRWAVADAAVAGGLACVVALGFFSASRAGVLILLAGGALWLGGLRGRHRPGRLLAVATVALVVAGGLFFAFKSPARDRLLEMGRVGAGRKGPVVPTPGSSTGTAESGGTVAAPNQERAPADPPSEFRLVIYRDTLNMIRDQPWTGSGLGTFAGVFPQYRQASLVEFNALHPESDWLMLMAEAGAPALACAGVLAGLAARRLAGLGEQPYWPLRWACAAAAAAAFLHGAVDVPAHRAALGWWMLALAGLALQRQPAGGGGGGERTSRQAAKPPREEGAGGSGGGGWQGGVQRAVFVLGGMGALALGGRLVRAEWFGGAALPPFAAENAPRRMFEAYQRKDYAAGEALGRRTLRDAPLTASAYYYLGIILAVSDEEGVDQQVDEMFLAERVLDPIMPNVPRRQAPAWAGYDPVRQTAMLLEELGRMGRINRALARGLPETLPYYGNLVGNAVAQPDVQRRLLAAARPDPRFEAAWMRSVNPAMGQTQADGLAADAAWVGQGGTLRPDWYLQSERAGPSRAAAEASEGTPGGEWEDAGWAVRLRQCVYAGRHQRAVEMLTRRFGISLALPEGAAGTDTDTDTDAGAAAAEAWRRQAALAAHDGKWKDAWLALERYVRHTRQTEWP